MYVRTNPCNGNYVWLCRLAFVAFWWFLTSVWRLALAFVVNCNEVVQVIRWYGFRIIKIVSILAISAQYGTHVFLYLAYVFIEELKKNLGHLIVSHRRPYAIVITGELHVTLPFFKNGTGSVRTFLNHIDQETKPSSIDMLGKKNCMKHSF